MYNNALAVKTYQNVNNSTISGRETEARVLSQAALKLKNCINKWDSKERNEMLDEALRYNQRIWTIFQSELANKDHPLPKKLREDLLSLSIFIDKKIFEVMAYPDPEKLNIIININQNIAAGLRNTMQGA